MRIAERRVGEQQPLLRARPLGEFLRPELIQQLPRAVRAARRIVRRNRRRANVGRPRLAATSGLPLTITSPR